MKLPIVILAAALIAVAGCVKETYEIDKLSRQGHLTPGFGISVVKGTMTLSDIIKKNDTIDLEGDTIFILDDNVVTFIFRKDSLISFGLDDYYNYEDLLTYSDSFEIGEMELAPFSGTISYTLGQISNKFAPPLKAQFASLDGSTADFPSFPLTQLDDADFTAFSNFRYATFSQGFIDVRVTNNLMAPLDGATIRLFNTLDHSQVGDDVVFSSIDPGETAARSINLTGLTMTNELTAEVILTGCPGTSSPVPIDLDASNIEVSVSGRDLLITSGRVILPLQSVNSIDSDDTLAVDAGEDAEITLIKILAGTISYDIVSSTPLTSVLSITLPTSSSDGNPISDDITVLPDSTFSGDFQINNSTIDLSSDPAQPYNMLPLHYNIEVSSNGEMIDFNSTDGIHVDLDMVDPDIDYIKGYFGQYGDTIQSDTLDLFTGGILDKITGSYLISSPAVRLEYFNSFAIPMNIDMDVVGYNGNDSVDIDFKPVDLSYPAAPDENDKTGVLVISKDNSHLPEIISMPPEKIRIGGSAILNPDGNTGSRDNYIFGGSRFLGNLEVEVPLEFRLNNLQFSDTVENPFYDEDFSDSPFDPENIESLKVLMEVNNGFPLGISLSVILYDSIAGAPRDTINAADILQPAPVDSNGRVSSPEKSTTEIKVTNDFWKWIKDADKLIFSIKLVTTENGTKDVKIYSDYSIDYKAALFVKPELKFSFD